MASRDQALSLLTAANNHADLAVKLSSLKQAKDILLSIEPSLAAELFPYLVELQYSPESLVRKMLVEIIEEICFKAMEHCSTLIPVLLAFLRDSDPIIARQSLVTGTHLFSSVLEEMAFQSHRRGKVERWLEELWIWMLKFKDSVSAIAVEPGSVGTKLLALKFLETYVLLFTSDTDSENQVTEGNRRLFNISWLAGGHPILDAVALMSDANRTLNILLDFLRMPSRHPGSLTIAIVNCLASIGRKRPVHYDTVFSALLDFDQNLEMAKGSHNASLQYSLRTAFLGFLRCAHPAILESRDRLLRALRAMNAGDAADQVIRQVDKLIKINERASRESRFTQDDQPPSQQPVSGEQLRKRPVPLDSEEQANGHEVAPKRIRYGPDNTSTMPIQINDSELETSAVNGVSNSVPLLDSDLTPAEQMIAIIGALLAEGERGAESLEVLIKNMHPELLADIVVTNMKHLPKSPPPLTRLGNLPVTQQFGSLGSPAPVVSPSAPTTSVSAPTSAPGPFSAAMANSSASSDLSVANNFPVDSKRDPRRDPRRLDPRRVATAVGMTPTPVVDDSDATEPEFDGSSLTKPISLPAVTHGDNPPALLMVNSKSEDKSSGVPLISEAEQLVPKDDVVNGPDEIVPTSELNASSDLPLSPREPVDEDCIALKLSHAEVTDGTPIPSLMEYDEYSPAASNASVPEETYQDLPQLPLYVELTEEQQKNVRKLAVERIVESYRHLCGVDCSQTRMALLARLVAQIDADDEIVAMLQKHILVDYQQQKGHDLVIHILYHLHSLMILDAVGSLSYAAILYEKILLAVAKSLLDTFPASDKSFSRFLGEIPLFPDSALKLLEDLCHCDVFDSHGKEVRDRERVTQGLGAVWSLILGRPNNRQACLDIALKCAVHSQDDIRVKAIRLVANKLYQLNYISEHIEQFATKMLLSTVDQHISDVELPQPGRADQREGEVISQETSVSGSQASEMEGHKNDSMSAAPPAVQSASVSSAEAQRRISLFFALCTKKPSLLQLVFDIYGRAPKAVKQAVHRHIPILIRALGPSYSELLRIISDPPEGCENLLMLVLQVLTQETTPSADLIATVKHLYESKLKDATILIPILSSLSKNEVLPIFPRLVNLPIEKFQMAVAHILQGSAHTGPALTPAEVLVAIHNISPDKDGLPLKKVTDVCSACFEQRTVFTQQVFSKALNQMVDQTPLPLLFMRTVIQAIDAFPSLVDFVMEILSKLVSRQVWKMPKLWVGFLKCVSQTQPHSFHVLLQLPPPQLESALNKHGNLRVPLAAYASQPNIRTSIPSEAIDLCSLDVLLHLEMGGVRLGLEHDADILWMIEGCMKTYDEYHLSTPLVLKSTLAVLGLANESHKQQPHVSSIHSAETSSSTHGTNLT